jgi:hypothetical protein
VIYHHLNDNRKIQPEGRDMGRLPIRRFDAYTAIGSVDGQPYNEILDKTIKVSSLIYASGVGYVVTSTENASSTAPIEFIGEKFIGSGLIKEKNNGTFCFFPFPQVIGSIGVRFEVWLEANSCDNTILEGKTRKIVIIPISGTTISF